VDILDPSTLEFWTPVGVALLCGGLIGFERQVRGKPAGVRTSILICLSTCVFIHLGNALDGDHADPTRTLGQVVTGVGFLGGGVMFAREGVVSGATTAAVIWVLAAIGATIGLGQFLAAFALACVTVGVLTGVQILESSARWLRGATPSSPDDDAPLRS
jgi:putative Mg2+ transporter-C (MgtC) family protein